MNLSAEPFSRRLPASRCVALVASAGGVQALREILGVLPPDFPAAVALVQHRPPRGANADPLVTVLQTRCRLPVKIAAEGERLLAGTVYIAPADEHFTVTSARTVHLFDGRRIRSVRSSGNPLFESAAKVYGKDLVAVVLTGGDSDGTDGIRTVAASGGVVIAEDPRTALVRAMPQSAIDTGAVARVLPLEAIGPAILELVA